MMTNHHNQHSSGTYHMHAEGKRQNKRIVCCFVLHNGIVPVHCKLFKNLLFTKLCCKDIKCFTHYSIESSL